MHQTLQGDKHKKLHGRIRCAVLLSPMSDAESDKHVLGDGRKSGHIQISPSKEGPWTTVRLNYAAPAACWRLGNDVVASEVRVKDDNRYVIIRSLVSVTNNTDCVIDVCLNSKAPNENLESLDDQNIRPEGRLISGDGFETAEFFETEKYNPSIGWVSCPSDMASSDQSSFNQVRNRVLLKQMLSQMHVLINIIKIYVKIKLAINFTNYDISYS